MPYTFNMNAKKNQTGKKTQCPKGCRRVHWKKCTPTQQASVHINQWLTTSSLQIEIRLLCSLSVSEIACFGQLAGIVDTAYQPGAAACPRAPVGQNTELNDMLSGLTIHGNALTITEGLKLFSSAPLFISRQTKQCKERQAHRVRICSTCAQFCMSVSASRNPRTTARPAPIHKLYLVRCGRVMSIFTM